MENKIRCFIAIDIPNKLKERIGELSKELEKEINIGAIKPVTNENLHITLKFLGNVLEKKLAIIEQRLKSIQFKPFLIHLKGVGVFPSEEYIRVIWLGCLGEEIEELAEKINHVLAKDFRKEGFVGHLTIARVKKKVELKDFIIRHKNDDFGTFLCKSFELKKSRLEKDGAVYTILARFDGVD